MLGIFIYFHLLLAQGTEVLPGATQDLRARSVGVAEEVLRKLPGNARVLRDLGKVHERFGSVDLAVKAYRESLKADPAQAGVLLDLGALLAPGAPEEARASYREALRLNPRLSEVHTRLGLLLAGEGRHRNAVDELREEIRNRSADARTYEALGRSLVALKTFPQAERSFEAALRLDRRSREAHLGLAQVWKALGRPADEARALAEAEKQNADGGGAPASAGTGRREEEVAALTCLAAGETLLQAGFREDGRKLLGEALRFDPGLDGARKLLVEALRQDKQGDEAIARCREGLFLARTPERLYLLAGLLVEKEAHAEAVSLLDEVIERDRSSAAARRELARLILRKKVPGDPARALKLAEEAVKRSPVATNFGILGWARHVNGDVPGAREALETAISLDPQNRGYRELLKEIGETRL